MRQRRMRPAEETFAAMAESEGLICQKTGWPDFLVCDRETGRVYVVEIKDGGDGVRLHQAWVLAQLHRAGIPAFVFHAEQLVGTSVRALLGTAPRLAPQLFLRKMLGASLAVGFSGLCKLSGWSIDEALRKAEWADALIIPETGYALCDAVKLTAALESEALRLRSLAEVIRYAAMEGL